MKRLALATVVAIAAFTDNASAQIEPSSVKASFRYTLISICAMGSACTHDQNLTEMGSQTFAVASSVTDQFGPTTIVSVNLENLSPPEFQLNEDPNYQVGDESVSITRTDTIPAGTRIASLKMSWKNGLCKVRYKSVTNGSPVNFKEAKDETAETAALPPGNPGNTMSMSVRFENAPTTLAESIGYFSYQLSQSKRLKPGSNSGYTSKETILVKSKQQVGDPEAM